MISRLTKSIKNQLCFPNQIGIIGGSGFYDLDELTEAQEVNVETEFGFPSHSLVTGKIGGIDCVVLAR